MPISWNMNTMDNKHADVLLLDNQLQFRLNIKNVKAITHLSSSQTELFGAKYIDFKFDDQYHIKNLLGEPIAIKRCEHILPNMERWKKVIKKFKSTSYLQAIQIKPYAFSNDDEYNTISPSLRIDFAPKKKLAPNEPIPTYNATNLQKKFDKRDRIFSFRINV